MNQSNYLSVLFTLLLVLGFGQCIGAEKSKVGVNWDSLVVVTQIFGIDEQGESKLLYNGESGRIYRLDNIDQAIHDLNGKSIRQKGTYRHIYAVLSDTTFVMDSNQTPRPSTLADAGIEQKIDLSVDNIHVTKDRVTAIYTTNCHDAASI